MVYNTSYEACAMTSDCRYRERIRTGDGAAHGTRPNDSPPTAPDSATTDRAPHTEPNRPSSDNGNGTPATEDDDNDDDNNDDNNDDRPSLDLDLLSNEERVVAVLKRSGGRAKQQQTIDELGWTAAKTNSVVSQLREDGTIKGFRLVRENLLELTDEEPENDTDNTTDT